MNRNFAPENGGAATRNQEEKRELQKKVHGKICEGISLFWLHVLFPASYLLLFPSTPVERENPDA